MKIKCDIGSGATDEVFGKAAGACEAAVLLLQELERCHPEQVKVTHEFLPVGRRVWKR